MMSFWYSNFQKYKNGRIRNFRVSRQKFQLRQHPIKGIGFSFSSSQQLDARSRCRNQSKNFDFGGSFAHPLSRGNMPTRGEQKDRTSTHKQEITHERQRVDTTSEKGKLKAERGGKSSRWMKGVNTRRKQQCGGDAHLHMHMPDWSIWRHWHQWGGWFGH